MGMQYKVTASEVKERYFTCERCGAFGEVQFQAIGDGGWVKESFWIEDAQTRAAAQAADALQADSDHVYNLIRCPACKQRPKRAFLGTYLRIGFLTVLGLAGVFAGGQLVIAGIGMGVLGAYYLFRDLRRLGRANRAMVYKLTKPAGMKEGKKEGKQEKQYKPLRAARPSQPPRATSAPVVPVRSSAPQIVQPRGPEDGPGFLK